MNVNVDSASIDLGAAARRWTWLAYAYGLLVSAVLGYFLLGLVIQVSDSFGNLLAVQSVSLEDLVRDQFSQRGYLRPLLWAQVKIVYELAAGQYYLWFRGIHVIQVALLIGLCVRLMRPRTRLDAALVPLALAALIGSHTFAPLVREAFPINSFLTIAIACVVAANVAFGQRSRWYSDAAIVVLLVGCVLTVESGILIWVVCAVAYFLGARGVSRRALVAMTACLMTYVAARMLVLDVGAPSLAERASGFGFGILEPSDLIARFQERPWVFYAYNVASSISTVLFSEPKGGVWRFVWELTVGNIHPWTVVSVLSSTAASVLLLWFARRQRLWMRRATRTYEDQLVIVFFAVLVVNAVISFPYTKNVIMSPAGVFLSVAVYHAARAWLQDVARQRLVVSIVLFTVLTCGWAFRVAGNHYNLRWTAAEQRAEWVTVDQWLERQRITLRDDRAHALRDALRRDAVWNHATPFQPSSAWGRWFDIDW